MKGSKDQHSAEVSFCHMKVLLSSGNDINALDDNDRICLHAAACSG